MAAADDEDVGLGGVAEFGLFALAALEPGGAVFVCAVVDAHVAGEAQLFFVASEFLEGGEELPGFAVAEAETAFAAANVGGKGEPGVGDAVRGGGLAFELPAGGSGGGVAGLEHVADLIAAFEGFDVPSEGDEVTPVGVFVEAVGGGISVVAGEGVGESFQPCGDFDGGSGACAGLVGDGHGDGSEVAARRLDGWVGCDLGGWIPKGGNMVLGDARGLYLDGMDFVLRHQREGGRSAASLEHMKRDKRQP